MRRLIHRVLCLAWFGTISCYPRATHRLIGGERRMFCRSGLVSFCSFATNAGVSHCFMVEPVVHL